MSLENGKAAEFELDLEIRDSHITHTYHFGIFTGTLFFFVCTKTYENIQHDITCVLAHWWALSYTSFNLTIIHFYTVACLQASCLTCNMHATTTDHGKYVDKFE